MRELVFTLEYDSGCTTMADTLAEYPDASVRSLSLHATSDSLWRVDHVSGSPAALADIEAAFLETDYYTDCLTPEHCGATQETEVLESSDDVRVLYSYWERNPTCASVPHMALDTLGEGLLFETRKTERTTTWRVVHSGTGDVRGFFARLEDSVANCVDIDFRRLSDTDDPVTRTNDVGDLTDDQEAALQAAVEHGYYETPREIDTGELAAQLDVPRSTLNYRLRRAEEHLAKRHVAELDSRERPASPE